MPAKLPVVLIVAEVRKVLDALTGVPRVAAMVLYGAGSDCRSALSFG